MSEHNKDSIGYPICKTCENHSFQPIDDNDCVVNQLVQTQQQIAELREAALHFQYCQFAGSELQFRCHQCVKFDAAITAAQEEGEP